MPVCVNCGKIFESKRADAVFCGPACRKRSSRHVTDNGEAPPVTDNRPDVTDNPPVAVTDKERALAMKKRADELQALQVAERGTKPHWSNPKVLIPGPYVPTPEREQRAAEILALRRKSARLLHPLTRD